ncbi:KTSC domain-containing protein [Rhodococcus erythropolis]|uniref:KTSC domain-containing protein n=1 Tax=Rhodococcus erythropolis TaxID=1833 RepID=UPI00379880EB
MDSLLLARTTVHPDCCGRFPVFDLLRKASVVHLTPIRSRNVRAVGYHPGSRTLVVAFHSGGTYEYYDVAQVLFDELTNSVPRPWTRVGAAVKRHRCAPIRPSLR